ALRAKVRSETQTSVGSADALRKILHGLGFVRAYRYQKYRSHHRWSEPVSGSGLSITLDETPIAVFIVLEGDKGSIDRTAGRGGLSESDSFLDDYPAFQEAWWRERGLPDGDRVFRGSRPGGWPWPRGSGPA